MKIDTSKWEKFLLSDLFEIKKGVRLTKADMKEGKIRHIGASAFNNGVTCYISNNENLFPKNTLTVNYDGSIGETFYQEEVFWASDAVNVLIPKFKLNKYIALFMAPIIKKIGKNKYIYDDKWKVSYMVKDSIYLPVKKDKSPDWEYMEKFIKNIEHKVQNNFNNLCPCIFQ